MKVLRAPGYRVYDEFLSMPHATRSSKLNSTITIQYGCGKSKFKYSQPICHVRFRFVREFGSVSGCKRGNEAEKQHFQYNDC